MHFFRYLILIAFTSLFISIGLPFASEAQRAGVGITAGVNTSSHLNSFRFVGDDIDLDFYPGFTAGFNAGLVLRRHIRPSVRIQAEPGIAMMGARYNESFQLRGFQFETDSRTELYYIQVPILLQYTTTPTVYPTFGRQRSHTTYHLTGGLFGGYLFDARFSGTNSGAPIGIEFQGAFSNDVRDQYKNYDGGIILGAGFEHGYNTRIGFEARFTFSVIDSGNQPDINFEPRNVGMSLSVYYIL